MKFLVARSKKEALLVAKTELLWKPLGCDRLLDLFRDEVKIISKASEMEGYRPEVVYLLPSFNLMEVERWSEFIEAFTQRNIKTQKVLV